MTQTRIRSRSRRILNCLDSPDTEEDWRFQDAVEAGMLGAVAALPPEIDLRENSWWKIGNQGTTGSCVGWASADSVIRWSFVKAGRLDKDDPLSVRYVWMASKETDEFTSRPTTFIESDGTSLKSALNVARKYGVVREADLPFIGGALYQGSANAFYAVASQMKIASFFNLGRNLSNWRTWLATNGPILTRLDVDATWDSAADTQGKLEKYQPETRRGGHAVALVGYQADQGFIVRNSWGTGWGHRGFAYATARYAEEAFTEAYGVKI